MAEQTVALIKDDKVVNIIVVGEDTPEDFVLLLLREQDLDAHVVLTEDKVDKVHIGWTREGDEFLPPPQPTVIEEEEPVSE